MKTNGSKARHKFSAETKLQILKEGRHTNLSISQVCDECQTYHSQSNDRDERVHRTFREEMPLDETILLYEVRHVIVDYGTYYNQRRPHSALKYLCSHDYYRGDPVALLAQRESKLRAAAEKRRAYWEQQGPESHQRVARVNSDTVCGCGEPSSSDCEVCVSGGRAVLAMARLPAS
jgi:hypothetical protein